MRDFIARDAGDVATIADLKVAALVAKFAAGVRDERLGDARLQVATSGRVVLLFPFANDGRVRPGFFDYQVAYLSAAWAKANL